MQRNDGGAAFPGETVVRNGMHSTIRRNNPGMSLRDWFAGQALAGLCATENEEDRHYQDEDPVMVCRVFAVQAYMLADAMLAARDGGDNAA